MATSTGLRNTIYHWSERGYELDAIKAQISITNMNSNYMVLACIPCHERAVKSGGIYVLPRGHSLSLNSIKLDDDDCLFITTISDNAVVD